MASAAAAAAAPASSEEAVKVAKSLMVGAGGIGCELLGCLSSFSDIHVIDLDTIDVFAPSFMISGSHGKEIYCLCNKLNQFGRSIHRKGLIKELEQQSSENHRIPAMIAQCGGV